MIDGFDILIKKEFKFYFKILIIEMKMYRNIHKLQTVDFESNLEILRMYKCCLFSLLIGSTYLTPLTNQTYQDTPLTFQRHGPLNEYIPFRNLTKKPFLQFIFRTIL